MTLAQAAAFHAPLLLSLWKIRLLHAPPLPPAAPARRWHARIQRLFWPSQMSHGYSLPLHGPALRRHVWILRQLWLFRPPAVWTRQSGERTLRLPGQFQHFRGLFPLSHGTSPRSDGYPRRQYGRFRRFTSPFQRRRGQPLPPLWPSPPQRGQTPLPHGRLRRFPARTPPPAPCPCPRGLHRRS